MPKILLNIPFLFFVYTISILDVLVDLLDTAFYFCLYKCAKSFQYFPKNDKFAIILTIGMFYP